MKRKILSALLSIAMLFTATSSFAEFYDMENHWAKDYVREMEEAGLLYQFGSGHLYPDRPITREECTVLLADMLESFGYKASQVASVDNSKFPDLPINTDEGSKIRSLSSLYFKSKFLTTIDGSYSKIVDGYPDGYFKPENAITRAEFSKLLINSIDCFGYLGSGYYTYFHSDLEQNGIKHWAYNHMYYAYILNIMNGYYQHPLEDGITYVSVQPDNHITRAEAIKMVAEAIKLSFSGYKPSLSETRDPGEELFYTEEVNPYISDKIKTEGNGRYGFSIDLPENWELVYSENGDGLTYTYESDGVELRVWGTHWDLSEEAYNESTNAESSGGTAETLNLENTYFSFKTIYSNRIEFYAKRGDTFIRAQLTEKRPGSKVFDRAAEAIDTLRVHPEPSY